MSDTALEPKLTKHDLRVLTAVSPCGEDEWRRREVDESVTVWQIGEALNVLDLFYLNRTLSGLEHLGYVDCAESSSRRRAVYWRTKKGDEAVKESER